MAITQITAGQEDWLSTLNSDLSQIGDKVSSTTVPITAINGCSVDGSTVVYHIGSRYLAITTGSISIGSALSASNKSIDFGRLASDTDAYRRKLRW